MISPSIDLSYLMIYKYCRHTSRKCHLQYSINLFIVSSNQYYSTITDIHLNITITNQSSPSSRVHPPYHSHPTTYHSHPTTYRSHPTTYHSHPTTYHSHPTPHHIPHPTYPHHHGISTYTYSPIHYQIS
jgi:hypothetical protein